MKVVSNEWSYTISYQFLKSAWLFGRIQVLFFCLQVPYIYGNTILLLSIYPLKEKVHTLKYSIPYLLISLITLISITFHEKK